ncbi:EpsG family protein [Shinella sp. H4-D48]|uniref:EpsG family protein n=1 Tax=Shinella sp. H4-D48 TaxID=2925841 RepID=UPI001F52C09C|nr:EpsG family protein [Shinella sp. H4-D48]UNK38239.1 EpsG family protein [Shinella sp. H4-D48]
MTGWAYWLMLIAAAALVPIDRTAYVKLGLPVFALIAIVLIGLRRDVGGDWDVYIAWLDAAVGAPITDFRTDLGYSLLNWVGANLGGGIYLVNTVCAAIAVGCLVVFSAHQNRPGLALVAAVPYLMVVVYTGYTRQSVAIGLGMLAIIAAQKQSTIPFVVLVTIAALFHKSAVVLFVFAPAIYRFPLGPDSFFKAGGMTVYAICLTFLLFVNSFGNLLGDYVLAAQAGASSENFADNQKWASTGAVFRLLQLSLFGAIVVIFWKRLGRQGEEPGVWGIAAAAVLTLLVLSFSRSTIADRIGLYFIPLSMYVYSVAPGLLGPKLEKFAAVGLFLVSAGSLWVWLGYGTHSRYWVPYNWALLQQ